MIDTITLKYIKSDYTGIEAYNKDYNLIKSSLNLIKDIKYKKHPRNGAEEQFEKQGWDLLLQKFESHFILNISLWKFYKGNNLLPFGAFEVALALKQLSSFLGVRIEKGSLHRVDIGQNFEMDQPVGRYIQKIQRPFKMEFLFDYTNETIGFRNTSRNQQIVIYDKIAKAKRNGDEMVGLPKNILRYEFRFKRQLRHSINWNNNKAKIKGAQLYSTTFLFYLIDSWFKGFCKIDLPYEPSGVALIGTAGYKSYLVALGIKAKGLENCYKEIEMIVSDIGKPMSGPSKSKLRRDLRELMTNRSISQPSPFIRELRKKIAMRFKELKRQRESAIFPAG
jgi:hypothetical protein